MTLALTAAAKGKGKLTVDLLLDWESVATPQISPDGAQVVYTRTWTDKVNDRFENDIWIINADGTKNRFLVKGSSPRWSPDGKRLIYTAPGQPSGNQIWMKWMDSGDETQLTRLERAASNIAWSPDGKRIAFNMTAPSKPAFTITLPSRPQGAKWIEPPRVIDRLDYRSDGQGYRADGFTHIFVIPDTGGTPRQLTDGDFNHGAPEWADARTIVFSGIRKQDAEYARGDSEIYKLSITDGGIKQLTDRKGPDQGPVISPDGRSIAYLGHDENDDTYNITRLYVMDIDGGNKKSLTDSFDRSVANPHWAPDGTNIYFITEDKGTENLRIVASKGGPVRQITEGNHQLTVSSMAKNGTFSGITTSASEPGDVVVVDPKQATIRKITDVNGDLLEDRQLGNVEEIWYDSVGGKKVQGWIVKPPDFDASKKYPLMLYIHGGPHTMYGVGFNFEFQNHAAEGYVVLYTNPRGSSGYGKEFGNAINNNYPGQDYDDLMNGVDAVIKKGYVDERNLFVCGGSGGGVLTAWIVGHTHRFTAAVSMKPVINWYSFVGTTDGSSWYYNFKKLPWEDPSEHLRRSPITYVGNVTTPTMLIEGEIDLRTPIEETEQFYRALKLRKVDTVMVRLPDEYHGFNASPRHPSNRLQQILYLRGWFEKYRKKS
jgi:dipeptidyl aminopeptidase/acylaminoacyl peptidase